MNAPARLPVAPAEPPPAVALDVDRNVISVEYSGHITVRGMKRYRESVVAALIHVRPGFTMVTDLSKLETMDLDCVADLAAMMDAIRACRAGHVIRVVPDPMKDIGFNILSIVHYRGTVGIVTVNSVTAVEQVLARLAMGKPVPSRSAAE